MQVSVTSHAAKKKKQDWFWFIFLILYFMSSLFPVFCTLSRFLTAWLLTTNPSFTPAAFMLLSLISHSTPLDIHYAPLHSSSIQHFNKSQPLILKLLFTGALTTVYASVFCLSSSWIWRYISMYCFICLWCLYKVNLFSCI